MGLNRIALAWGIVGLIAACGGASHGNGAATSPDGGDDAGGSGIAPAGASLGDAAQCGLVSQGTAGIALKATILVPSGAMAGEVLVDATGTITCVDTSCANAAGYSAATQIVCANGVVSPGFVNAHDHTDYDFTPPVQHGTTRWQHRNEWRTGADGGPEITPSPASTSDANTLAAIELRFLMSGVTSVVGTGGSPGLVRNLAAYDDPTWLEGLSGKTVYFDTFPLGDENGTILTSGCAYPSIIKPSSAFEDGVYAPHFAEGINPGAENEIECAATAAIGLLTPNTAVLHAVGTNAKDVAAIADAGSKVVWAPRSNISLYGNTMPITEMKRAGVPISLGTDWLPTGSMNMLRELACADEMNSKYFGGAFDDPSLVAMATSNGAAAMGFGTQIGTIAVGMQGDLVVFAASGTPGWRTVIDAASEDVALVLRGGTALYGDQAVVQAANGGTACDAMSVCGIDKAVCLDVPNVTLSDIQTAASSTYPLYFCRGQIPTGEPTCIPYRDTYPNGTSATDQDGDGIPDTSDDCPTVFNPPRSMDDNVQSDVDGDGFGDACDTTPFSPTGP
ncbi:MAG: amidohydrolase family protein [Polyangiaceae bacterium]|jgi:imidazolonepropionase-like amidohydrolase